MSVKSQRLPLKRIKSKRIHLGVDYWNAIKGGKELPARRDFDPAAVPNLLPYIILCDFHYDPFRVRLRLVGTRIVELEGHDRTGCWIEEDAWAAELANWYDDYSHVVTTRQPLFGVDAFAYEDRTWVSYEWGILPLSNDGLTIDRALEFVVYENEPELVHYPLAERPMLPEQSGDPA